MNHGCFSRFLNCTNGTKIAQHTTNVLLQSKSRDVLRNCIFLQFWLNIFDKIYFVSNLLVGCVQQVLPQLFSVGPSKNWVTCGVPKILIERRDNPEKGGVDVEMGGCHFFITLMFNCIYCVYRGKVKFPLLYFSSFELTMQDSHPSHFGIKIFYHLYIFDPFWCLQTMQIALFKLVWNT